MRRTLLVTALLLGSALGAQARPVNAYYDLIRPNGHPRSDAIHQADMAACYRQTGASRYRLDTPAYRKCMLGRGYRWMWGRNVADPPSGASDSYSYTYPEGTLASPPPVEPYVAPPPPPLDATTGMPIPGYSY